MKYLQLPGLVLALVLAAFLAGCSDSDSDSGTASSSATGSTTAAAPTATAEPAAAAFPVTIEHKFGETTIESEPQRVLSLGYMEQDPLLALGVKPIATRYWFSDEPYGVLEWAKDELGDAKPEVLNMPFGELDYEKIAALQPDLISAVYSGITEEEYQLLAQIAPTIAQTGDYIDFGMPWQEGTVLIGRAVGQEELAAQLVDDLAAKFEAVKAAHPDWQGKSVAVVAPRPDGQTAIFGSGDLRSRVFIDLGFEVPEEFDEITGESFYADVSSERADLFDQDLVVVHQLSYYEGGEAALKANLVWSALDAAKEGRAVYIPFELDTAYGFNSVLSMEYFLDGILPEVEAALGGASVSGASFPVTIEHKYGSTEIPAEPERVVTVGFTDQDYLLAFGVVPVGIRDWFGEKPFATWPWAQSYLDGQEPEVLPRSELDFEQIAALEPELIVAIYAGLTQEEYDLLAQIAPTITQPPGVEDYGITWQEQTRFTGKILGQPDKAEELIAGVQAQVEAAKAAYPELVGKSVVLASAVGGDYYVYGAESTLAFFVTSLGLVMPDEIAALADNENGYFVFNAERLDLVDADLVVWMEGPQDEGPAALLANPVYQQLPVHTEGRDLFLGFDVYAGAISFSSVLSLPMLLEDVVPAMADAIDGDPATVPEVGAP